MSGATTMSPPARHGSGPADTPAPGSAPTAGAARPDAMLRMGRALLYPGLALTSVLLLRGPLEMPVGDILMAGAGIFALLSMRRPPRRLPVLLGVAAVLVVAGGVLASSVSQDPLISLTIMARLAYMVIGIPWLLLMLLEDARHFRRAVIWWLGGAAVCALGTMVQFGLGDVIPGGAVTADNRFTGFTTHPSDMAGISAMATAAGLATLAPGMTGRARWLAWSMLAASAVSLVLSGGVSGMLGLAAGVMFLFARRAIHLRQAVWAAVAGGILLAVLITRQASIGARNPWERFLLTTGISGTSSESDTASVRLELAERAVRAIGDSPVFGQGLITKDNVLLKSFTVHNNLLAAWTAGGVLMFLGVLLATGLALRYSFRRSTGDPLFNAVGAAVVTALAFAQTAPGIYNRYYWIPMGFAVFLAWRSTPRRGRPARYGGGAGAPVGGA